MPAGVGTSGARMSGEVCDLLQMGQRGEGGLHRVGALTWDWIWKRSAVSLSAFLTGVACRFPRNLAGVVYWGKEGCRVGVSDHCI